MTRILTTLFLALVVGNSGQTRADIVTIDFESFSAGIYGGDFLSAYGVADILIGGSSGAAGPRILDFTGHLVPSGVNALVQHQTSLDPGQVQSLTFVFSKKLTAFSLSRLGSAVSSTPAWSAVFLDEADSTLGSFGESTWQNRPAIQQFDFTAPSGTLIKKMRLESVWTVTTFRNIPVDDFVLTQVPEPGSAILFCALGGLLALGRRKRRD